MNSEAVYTSSQVGDRLGLKSGMIRRYHLAYESVTGEELPRDPQTNGRLVTDDILSVLERSRNLVRESPSLSSRGRHTLGSRLRHDANRARYPKQGSARAALAGVEAYRDSYRGAKRAAGSARGREHHAPAGSHTLITAQ